MKAFVISQFIYCPLIWISHDRSVNKKIDKIYERALRIAQKVSCSNFEESLIKANPVPMHYKDLQLLTTEIFKFNPSFMHRIFEKEDTQYTIRSSRNI